MSVRKGVRVTLVLDVPDDTTQVRLERDVLDLVGRSIPWDRLPAGTRLDQARTMRYLINEPDVPKGGTEHGGTEDDPESRSVLWA